jgi:hypothetical protein
VDFVVAVVFGQQALNVKVDGGFGGVLCRHVLGV